MEGLLWIFLCCKISIALSISNSDGDRIYSAGVGVVGSGDHRGRPPGWKWWRYRESSEKEILDHLLERQRYDKREKPPSKGLLKINASVVVLGVETSKEFNLLNSREVEYLLSLMWMDPRLIHLPYEDHRLPSATSSSPSASRTRSRGSEESIPLHLDGIYHTGEIWSPNVRSEERDSSVALRIHGNGTVFWLIRRRRRLTCRGKPEYFPFDEPVCSTTIETSSREDDLGLVWNIEKPMVLSSSAGLPSYLLKNMMNADCSHRMNWNGNGSCLEMEFVMRRDLSYFWSNLFVPDMVLVTSSFLTFWLDWRRGTNPRIILLVALTLNYFIARMPVVSSSIEKFGEEDRPTSAIYVWQAVSVLFIYASVAEFVLAGYVGSKSYDSYTAHNYYSHYQCRKRQLIGGSSYQTGVLTIDPENLEEGERRSIGSFDQASQHINTSGRGDEDLHHNYFNPIRSQLQTENSKFDHARAQKFDRISRILFPTLYVIFLSTYFFKYLFD